MVWIIGRHEGWTCKTKLSLLNWARGAVNAGLSSLDVSLWQADIWLLTR